MKGTRLAKTRQYLLNLVTLGCAVVFIFGCLELYVRFFEDDGMQYDLEMWKYAKYVKVVSDDPLIGHEHRPNADARLMGVRVTTNSAGLRNEEIPVAKKPGTYRIVMLGDSVLFGWGANQDKTVSARLQSQWRSAGRDIEVINGGDGNYNTIMEVEFFLKRLAQYHPDMIVLNYFINDAEPVPSHATNIFERNSEAWVFYSSRLDIAKRELEVGQGAGWQDYYNGLYDNAHNPGGWSAAAQWIGKLAEYSRANGIKLLVVNYPELHVLKPYPFPQVSERLSSLCSELGVPYLDLLGAVQNEEPSTLWVTRPDPHPNDRAHGFYAAAIQRWVEDNHLLQ
jgi:lysophospholipase L1-like esterase